MVLKIVLHTARIFSYCTTSSASSSVIEKFRAGAHRYYTGSLSQRGVRARVNACQLQGVNKDTVAIHMHRHTVLHAGGGRDAFTTPIYRFGFAILRFY